MSVVSELSIDDFKALFPRNFPYLPVYSAEETYSKGDVVYSEPHFYESLVDDNTAVLTDDKSWKEVEGEDRKSVV